MSDAEAPRPSDLEAKIARATAFVDAMHAMKGTIARPLDAPSVADEYEALRDRYASGAIELEDFAAGVVQLLQRGL